MEPRGVGKPMLVRLMEGASGVGKPELMRLMEGASGALLGKF